MLWVEGGKTAGAAGWVGGGWLLESTVFAIMATPEGN